MDFFFLEEARIRAEREDAERKERERLEAEEMKRLETEVGHATEIVAYLGT